jgi:hypothetical protein
MTELVQRMQRQDLESGRHEPSAHAETQSIWLTIHAAETNVKYF